MSLPKDFHFTQSNLQDFVDCRRRFQLRYLLQVAWPALESEPVQESERWMRQGAHFHRMLQQVFTGLPLEQIGAQEMDADLATWWSNFLSRAPGLLDFKVGDLPQTGLAPELTLTASIEGFRFIVKVDLLVDRLPEKMIIVDWKTSRRAPRRETQAARIQTMLYPLVLMHCASRWNQDQPLRPEQIEMLYWYANQPEKLQRFRYSAQQAAHDQAYLLGLVNEISSLGEDDFFLTPNQERCKYCVYRSLCDRGVSPGAFEAYDDEPERLDEIDLALDFDQISEIEF